jgi:hypothetical protein
MDIDKITTSPTEESTTAFGEIDMEPYPSSIAPTI